MDFTDSPDASHCILPPQHLRQLAILIIMDLGPLLENSDHVLTQSGHI